MTSHTAKLSPVQAETLRGILAKRDFDTAAVPHAVYSFRRPGLTVTWYESGKLLAQGKGTREFVEFTLEPEVLGEATLGYELETQPEQLEPRLGVDESGKGDFFGPLVVVGRETQAAERLRDPAFANAVLVTQYNVAVFAQQRALNFVESNGYPALWIQATDAPAAW